MSRKAGIVRRCRKEPRENIYCALGYARANAQPKARQPTRPKGHFINTFSFFIFILYSLLQRSTSRRVRAFLLFGAGIGKYDVSGKCGEGFGSCRGGARPTRGFAVITILRVNRMNGFPLWGKLSPQVTDEGAPAGHIPLIRRVPRHLPPKGEGFLDGTLAPTSVFDRLLY